MSTSVPAAGPAPGSDPLEFLRSRGYIALLVMGAILGVPVAVVAYFFLKFISETQTFVFSDLPVHLGFHAEPAWWPLLPLTLAGLLVALTIKYLPGTAGHKPAEGFKTGGPVATIDLPGVIVAAFLTLGLGAVLGPEAPLIAIGSGLGVLAVHLVKKDAPAMAITVIAAAGSFAAISTLFGSPLAGAFLLMEAAGLGGPLLGMLLVPGLLASGIGALIFVGLGTWTGFGPMSLAIANIPKLTSPTGAEFLWAIAIGVLAPVLGTAIRRAALLLQPIIEDRIVLLTPLAGVVVAGAAIVFAEATGRSSSEVLFSGQSALPTLIENASTWTVGALVLLLICKSVAYSVSLSGFRGGPVFPGMFIGAAGGIAMSHLPGLPMIAGAAMGIGAMTVAMLSLPLVSVLLPSLLLPTDSFTLIPLIIVAVTVSYVGQARLAPRVIHPNSTPAPSPTG